MEIIWRTFKVSMARKMACDICRVTNKKKRNKQHGAEKKSRDKLK